MFTLIGLLEAGVGIVVMMSSVNEEKYERIPGL
jgi:hypothetical protein